MMHSFRYLFLILFMFSGTLLFSQEINKNDLASEIEEQHPLLSNNFTFYVGAYRSLKEIKIGANGSTDNKLINFSKDFDFNNNEITLFLNFNWRFARMWSLSSEYFSVKNNGSKELSKDIVWDNVEFTVGTEVGVGFQLSMYRVMIGRTITKGLKHELGIGLGVHALDIESYIEGNVYLNDNDFNFEKRSVKALAPLPSIGAWYFYAPNNKWMFTARVDWFSISLDNYKGKMWNLGAGANYQFHKHFGVGLKYRYFDFVSDVNTKKWDGKFSLNFQGPLLTINANF